ncbi:MAG: SRPBCC family protein [Chloroflexi bacterium]|nr:SRPBCC family protein [Chloroflexota bacterium]MBV9544829.1 SRPBCC family protein [Chloroflexota bacterium]
MITNVSAERLIDAPPAVVYRCLADYQHHHRPGGFLPPAFSNMQVLEGGVGAGTTMRFSVRLAGRTRTFTHHVTEPEPGRVLVEGDDSVRTVFTVEPDQTGARVRVDTRMSVPGLEGVVNRFLAPRLMKPLYDEELRRLEEYARAQASTEVAA